MFNRHGIFAKLTGSRCANKVWNTIATILSLALLSTVPLTETACSVPLTPVHAQYWASSKGPVRFPEQDKAGDVWPDLRGKDNIGICFSGGGTRAASAAVGQMRALQKLRILQRTRYAAAVSGGTLALGPYTLLPDDRIDSFLGDYVEPKNLSENDLKPRDGSLTKAVSESFVTAKALGHIFALRGSESYSRTIADCVLKPFHLDEPNTWFTWNRQTAAKILKQNPGLREHGLDHYQTVAKGRPFFILGGTIRRYDLAPWEWNHNVADKRVPVEFTPLYSGVRPWVEHNKYFSHPVGGGYVESFAYDSIRPVKETDSFAQVSLYRRLPWRTMPVMTVGDIIGTSGAALGEVSFAVEVGFPKFNYWSPRALAEGNNVRDVRYCQEDGGLSENTGLMPLLARKVDRIIVFANPEKPPQIGHNPAFPDYINGLFGIEGKNVEETNKKQGWYQQTQVFEPKDLEEINRQLCVSIRNYGPAVAATTLSVRPNARFGVEHYTVKIFWVFLDAQNTDTKQSASNNWIKKLPNNFENLRQRKGMDHFPNYATLFENRGFRLWDIVHLTKEQATLLAHYTSWSVYESRHKLRAFLRDSHTASASRGDTKTVALNKSSLDGAR